jgi:ligand-binding SRPBCC domain-containing protein
MPVLEFVTNVAAPPDRVFDCARDVGLHTRSFASTRERVVGGRTDGLLDAGDEVTWEARHLLLRRRMTVRIVMYERPRWFRDQMVRGPFRVFHHDHYFEPVRDGTRMTDVVTFRAPLGWFGNLVAHMVIAPHLQRLLEERNAVLKAEAERATEPVPTVA